MPTKRCPDVHGGLLRVNVHLQIDGRHIRCTKIIRNCTFVPTRRNTSRAVQEHFSLYFVENGFAIRWKQSFLQHVEKKAIFRVSSSKLQTTYERSCTIMHWQYSRFLNTMCKSIILEHDVQFNSLTVSQETDSLVSERPGQRSTSRHFV